MDRHRRDPADRHWRPGTLAERNRGCLVAAQRTQHGRRGERLDLPGRTPGIPTTRPSLLTSTPSAASPSSPLSHGPPDPRLSVAARYPRAAKTIRQVSGSAVAVYPRGEDARSGPGTDRAMRLEAEHDLSPVHAASYVPALISPLRASAGRHQAGATCAITTAARAPEPGHWSRSVAILAVTCHLLVE